MRTGDLIGTGTLSGTTDEELGCLLEATRYGAKPYQAVSESSSGPAIVRTFLQDGDEVEFRAQADDGSGLGRVGFGTCDGKVFAFGDPVRAVLTVFGLNSTPSAVCEYRGMMYTLWRWPELQTFRNVF